MKSPDVLNVQKSPVAKPRAKQKQIVQSDSARHKSRLKDNPVTIDNVSLPGFNHLFRGGKSVMYKLFWLGVLTTCIVFTLIQSIQRIDYFLSRPIANQIILRHDSSNFTFPAITICFLTFYKVFWQKLDKFVNDTKKTTLTAEEIDHIWYKTYDEFIVNTYVACTAVNGRTSEECGDQRVWKVPWKRLYVTTAMGGCIELKETMDPDIGKQTGFIRISVQHSHEAMEVQDQNVTAFDFRPAGFYYYLHSTTRNPNSYYSLHRQHPVRLGEEVGLDILIRSFEFIDADHHRCQDAVTVEKCWRYCFHSLIQKKSMCRLPQFNTESSQPICNTVKSIKEACQATFSVGFDGGSKDCSCVRRCSVSVYSTFLYSVDSSENQSKSVVTFRPHSLQEDYHEFLSYDASALFSDLGGTMGLYLGFCIFTYIEFCEFIIEFLWACLRNKITKAASKRKVCNVSQSNLKQIKMAENSVVPQE